MLLKCVLLVFCYHQLLVSVVIRPHRKAHKKVSETLKELYGYLDSKFVASEIDVSSH